MRTPVLKLILIAAVLFSCTGTISSSAEETDIMPETTVETDIGSIEKKTEKADSSIETEDVPAKSTSEADEGIEEEISPEESTGDNYMEDDSLMTEDETDTPMDGNAGEDSQVTCSPDVGSSQVQHASPLRSRNRDSKAQEAQ